MDTISLHPLQSVPKTELAALKNMVFADYAESQELADVLAEEEAARSNCSPPEVVDAFGLAAFRGEALIGWSQGYREGKSQFYMLNSGVAPAERRRGVYSSLVNAMLVHAEAEGYSIVRSRHTAANNAVIIAKLRLGFCVSGFEYSEVYGPLVQLTYLISESRRKLYQNRASPIRRTQ
jgi:ribosomal protein S18 acetylase RimI-like enzyme